MDPDENRIWIVFASVVVGSAHVVSLILILGFVHVEDHVGAHVVHPSDHDGIDSHPILSNSKSLHQSPPSKKQKIIIF